MTELAVRLTGPVARAALADRDIATVYRALCAAGVSQARIAEATGQRQSEVSEILAGRRVQSIAVLERIADGLGVPRGWMGLAYTPGLGPEPADDTEGEDERDSNLFRHAGHVLFGAPIFGPVAPIRLTPTLTPKPSHIGFVDVEHVADTTEQLSHLACDLGGIPMVDALTAHTRASETLLGATMREPVRNRLLVVLSDAHKATGGAAADAGQRDLARQHYARGMDCAAAAGDLLRAVLNFDLLGYAELYIAPNDALKFFQLGAAIAPSGLCRAMLEYHCALAHGQLCLAKGALDALRKARDTYEAASHGPRPWKHFAAALPHIEARTYFALGSFDLVVAASASVVDAATHAVRCTVSNSCLLATAQLRCGELRAGLQTADQVLGLVKGLRSVSVREDLGPLQEAAAARRDSACRDLAHEVAALRAAA